MPESWAILYSLYPWYFILFCPCCVLDFHSLLNQWALTPLQYTLSSRTHLLFFSHNMYCIQLAFCKSASQKLKRVAYKISLKHIFFFTGVAAINQYIYVVGGYDGQQQINTVERYDTERGCWEFVTSMAIPRSALSVTVLDGKLYAMGMLCSRCKIQLCVNANMCRWIRWTKLPGKRGNVRSWEKYVGGRRPLALRTVRARMRGVLPKSRS